MLVKKPKRIFFLVLVFFIGLKLFPGVLFADDNSGLQMKQLNVTVYPTVSPRPTTGSSDTPTTIQGEGTQPPDSGSPTPTSVGSKPKPSPGTSPTPIPKGNPGSTCGGKYNLSGNPAHKNFGDPNCDFSKNKLANLLKQIDPLNANFWFNTIARNESWWYPDAWVHCKGGVCTPDPGGAWGLFQMGSSKPPVRPPNVPGFFHNQINDRGDVVWQVQAIKAVSRNCELYKIHLEWRYWGTATSRWGQNKYDASCKKLVKGY